MQTLTYTLKLTAFLAHFLSALFIGYVTARCGDSYVVDSYAEGLQGYPMRAQDACAGRDCFYSLPQAFLAPQNGLEWNVFALLAAFEWISASFSLFQLSPQGSMNYLWVSVVWNLAGGLLLMPYTTHLSALQAGITATALFTASALQAVPLVYGFLPGRVVMHYAEYCTSASLLYVAVLVLFVPSPPSWAPLVGFTGILLCNLCGIGAHLCLVDPLEPNNPAGAAEIGDGSLWDWQSVRRRFGLFLAHSWLALLMGVLSIIYLARGWLGDPIVPWWVRLILYNLLITYSLFGIFATVCYTIDGFTKSAWWVSSGLGTGLTVLSAAAKIPVVYSVFFGLIAEPGKNGCVF